MRDGDPGTTCRNCGDPANTREHRTKASDLRSLFGLPTQADPIYFHRTIDVIEDAVLHDTRATELRQSRGRGTAQIMAAAGAQHQGQRIARGPAVGAAWQPADECRELGIGKRALPTHLGCPFDTQRRKHKVIGNAPFVLRRGHRRNGCAKADRCRRAERVSPSAGSLHPAVRVVLIRRTSIILIALSWWYRG